MSCPDRNLCTLRNGTVPGDPPSWQEPARPFVRLPRWDRTMLFLDPLEIPLTCPFCAHSEPIPVGRLKVETDIVCTRCDTPLPLKREDFLREVKRIEEEIGGLPKILLRKRKK